MEASAGNGRSAVREAKATGILFFHLLSADR
jgi:hypothetical protein